MIDIENDVFDSVAKILRETFPGISVSGEYAEKHAKLPAVTIEEKSNSVYERMRADKIENAASVMYEVNVFSNKSSGKKLEAKEIANKVDEVLESLGFTRFFMNPVPNLLDSSIYRLTIRYRGVVGPNGEDNFLVYHI